MNRYAYYPGCSLETMAATYHVSSMEVALKLGIELEELEDWNCCGATAYTNVKKIVAHAISARNLALAEKAAAAAERGAIALVVANNVSNNTSGIALFSSSNATVADNDVFFNAQIGVSLTYMANVTVTANTFLHDGVFLGGDSLPDFNSHTIPSRSGTFLTMTR